MSDGSQAREMLVVTGMSGAGKTTTLKALEDAGYEAVDNAPLALFDALAAAREDDRPLALGADVRTSGFTPEDLLRRVDAVAAAGAHVAVVFLDCDDDVVLRRYTETRRRHPLAPDGPLVDGIRRERRLLMPLRDRADRVIDTSMLSPHELRRRVLGDLGRAATPAAMHVAVTSFSYRRGVPREADLVFDVRFLRNPHYVPDLKPLSGLDEGVRTHVAEDPSFGPFRAHLEAMIDHLLPLYEREGKSYLTIAFGCTGGRHRSVFLADLVGERLAGRGWHVAVQHRDIAVDVTERRRGVVA